MDQRTGKLSRIQQAISDISEQQKSDWTALQKSWRTEPEINLQRQSFLMSKRNMTPVVAQGQYPFSGVSLTRADIEWLLTTHNNGEGIGPINWDDESQRSHKGLDLRGADLRGVNLEGLPLACLQGGLTKQEWRSANTERRESASIHLEGSHLENVHLEGAVLDGAHLEAAHLEYAHLEEASLYRTHLEKAYFEQANLQKSSSFRAILQDADLESANLEGADLKEARLEGAKLSNAKLAGADLRRSVLSSETMLDDATLHDSHGNSARLADVRWNGADLSVLQWEHLTMLGDEQEARHRINRGTPKQDKVIRLRQYEAGVRANRQLATALRAQGLIEYADRFAYRAQLLQRRVLRQRRYLFQWLLSCFLAAIAGYGFKPQRSLYFYAIAVMGFAIVYFILGSTVGPHLSPLSAVVFSVTSFHGRGFFPGGIALDDPITVVAACEAVTGLVIEVSLIATFTQRFFAH